MGQKLEIDSSPNHLEDVSLAVETSSQDSQEKSAGPARVPWGIRIIPFFLSAIFFLSAFFAIFAPLPILLVHFRSGRKWAWAAVLTNSLIVGFLVGQASLAFYIVFVVALSLTLPELLKRKLSLEKSAVITLLTMWICGFFFCIAYGQIHHLNPFLEIQNQVATFVDQLGQSISTTPGLVNPDDLDEWKRSLSVEFPSAVAIFSLVLVWANLILLFRSNPSGLRESLGLDLAYLKKWKTPQFLVWPTLLTGFFLVMDFGMVSDVGLNIFKFLMAIYAIQGLSILSYFFDLWGVRGFFRVLGFSLSVFLMMPLVLSLGFFDLWFDFRSKFRQS